jgi:hypothetical protein
MANHTKRQQILYPIIRMIPIDMVYVQWAVLRTGLAALLTRRLFMSYVCPLS